MFYHYKKDFKDLILVQNLFYNQIIQQNNYSTFN